MALPIASSPAMNPAVSGSVPAVDDILRWLFGQIPRPRALQEGRCHWEAVFDRCLQLKLLPQAASRVADMNAPLPPRDAATLTRRRVEAFVQSAQTLQAGCRALAVLERAGIAAVGFKGIAAVGWLHGGRAERPLNDVDILTSAADLERAVKLLAGLGYRPKVDIESLADYVAFVRASPGSAGNEAISLLDDAGRDLDLHWKLGGFPGDEVLAASHRVRVLNADVPLVRPGLGMLLTVQHALRNDFVPEDMARDLIDLAAWFRLLAADTEEAAWAEAEAQRRAMVAPLGGVVAILADYGVPCPLHIAPHRGSERLADLYREQAAGTTLNIDLVSLCSPRLIWRMAGGFLLSGSRHLRIMRQMERANGEPTVPIARRIAAAWAAAWNTSPTRWLRLRTLARVKRALDRPALPP